MSDEQTGPVSRELFERACRVTPGGVHSPVRSFRDVTGNPLFVESARGATLTDADGRNYIDFCMSFGPLIFGHGDTDVRRACKEAIDRGSSFGAAESVSLELAELIVSVVPWIDSIRFVNSGTEAVMSAIRLSRAATGRTRIVKFAGCYHGHSDAMLIKAGSGLAGQSVPDSAGVPPGISADTLIAELDDESSIEKIFVAHTREIAGVIIEPVPANYGLLPQREEFIRRVAELCHEHGALLIFDEVITGFRLGLAGYAGRTGIHPDIVTWGKIIGGGLPVGAFAAKREIMELIAPAGPVYQAGTLSANPVAMTAGLVTLRKLTDQDVYRDLADLGAYLKIQLESIGDLRVQQLGSLFWLVPGGAGSREIFRSRSDLPEGLEERFSRLFWQALKDGLYLPPSPFECGFLSTVHTPEHIDRLRDSLRRPG